MYRLVYRCAPLLFIAAAAMYALHVFGNREFQLPLLPPKYASSVRAALVRSGENRTELVKALAHVRRDRLPAMCDIISRMPNYDLANITSDMLVDHVNCTFEVRRLVPWKFDTNSTLFLDYVLPYRVSCESLENSRRSFLNIVLPVLRKCRNTRQAAIEMMLHSHDQTIQQEDIGGSFPYDFPPLGAWRFARSQDASRGCRYSCMLVVSMLRSIGVPARILEQPARPKLLLVHHVYMQYYDDVDRDWRCLDSGDDKWFVEIFLHGQDSILPGLHAGGEVAEYASPPYLPGDVYGQQRYDRLVRVAPPDSFPSGTVALTVKDHGSPAEGAKVGVYAWSYDYNGWRSAVFTATDSKGRAVVNLGSNQVDGFPPYMVSASKGNRCVQGLVTLGAGKEIELTWDLCTASDIQPMDMVKCHMDHPPKRR